MTTIFGDTAQTYWQRVALMTSLQCVQELVRDARSEVPFSSSGNAYPNG